MAVLDLRELTFLRVPGQPGFLRAIESLSVSGESQNLNMAQAVAQIEAWILSRQRQYVCVVPAHSVMDAYRDPELLRILNHSGLTTPDGMSIVWLLKLHGCRHVSRVYGPDLMREVCRISADKGWRHFLYGGEPGVAERLKAI